MATSTVDVYAFFVNGASHDVNINKVKQDVRKANEVWGNCVKFILKGMYFSKSNRIVNASSISSNNVFKNNEIDFLINSARKTTGYKIGLYVLYLNGDYLAEGRGKRVIGVGGTGFVHFKSSEEYELYGRIILTDKAADRYTLAHEAGHVLFTRYNSTDNTFIRHDPSGPYIHTQTREKYFAHNNDRENIMFPISPSKNPKITSKQCKIAQLSKIVKAQ